MSKLPLTDEMAVIGPATERRKGFHRMAARGWLVVTQEGVAFMATRHLARSSVIAVVFIILALASELVLELGGWKALLAWWAGLIALGTLLWKVGLIREEFTLDGLQARLWIPAAEVGGFQVRPKTGDVGDYSEITLLHGQDTLRFVAEQRHSVIDPALQRIATWYPVDIARGWRGRKVKQLAPAGE